MSSESAAEAETGLKERILYSAIDEFGRKGYTAASTNAIVQRAGTSKGLLFHYYGSKKALFFDCVRHVGDSIREYLLEQLDFSDTDLFRRIKQITVIKMEFCKMHPEYYGLMYKTWYSEYVSALKDELIKLLDLYRYDENPVLRNTDTSRFRDGLSFNTAMKYLSMLMEIYWLRFSVMHNDDIDEIAAHIDEFLRAEDEMFELIKHGIYKE